AASAQTLSPRLQSVTPGPTSSTVPAISRPGMSEAPGGGGYAPRLCMTSGRFTPAASTLMRTSPARATGTGRSTGTSTSGPPAPAISIAIILSLTERRSGGRGLEHERGQRNAQREADRQNGHQRPCDDEHAVDRQRRGDRNIDDHEHRSSPCPFDREHRAI